MSFDWSTILGGITNAATGVASGGLLGLGGSLIQGITAYFHTKAQYSHDEEMADKQIELAKFNAGATLAQTQAQVDGDAFTASQRSVVGWLASSLVSIVREAITIALLYAAWRVYKESLDPSLKAVTAHDILELAGIAVTWHFGQRPATTYAIKRAVSSATNTIKTQ